MALSSSLAPSGNATASIDGLVGSVLSPSVPFEVEACWLV